MSLVIQELYTRFSSLESKPQTASLLSNSFWGQPVIIASIDDQVKSFLAKTWKVFQVVWIGIPNCPKFLELQQLDTFSPTLKPAIELRSKMMFSQFDQNTEGEHRRNQGNGRNPISVIEDGFTLPKYFITELDVERREFSKKSENSEGDLGRDEAMNTGASGTGLVRCPFCKELYIVDCQLKFLICPNDNCCKNTLTSRTDFEYLCDREEANVERKEKNDIITFEGSLHPASKQTDDSVAIRMGTALPTRAAVIRCGSCEGKILKFGGCNRLTCLCGQIVCYMCKEYLPRNSRFEHFCHHERYHSEFPCKLCKLCDLYEVQVANVRKKEEISRYDYGLILERKRNCEDDVAERAWIQTSWFSCT